MPKRSATIGSTSAVARSRVSNGSKMLPGVDGRSAAARRFRDLCADFARDLGGVDSLTTAEMALIRQAAVVVVQAEVLQAQILNGAVVENDDLVRLTNASTRVLTALGAQRRKREPAHVPLRDRIGGVT